MPLSKSITETAAAGSVIQPPLADDVKVRVESPQPQAVTEPQIGLSPAAALLSQKIDLTDPAKREQLVKQLRQIEDTEMEATRLKAERLGFPMIVHEPGGTKAILVGFEGDRPLYRADHNVNAAISSGANLVRSTAPFNVTGSGLKMGLWEAGGIPRTSHQEFGPGVRITIKDGSTTLSDHASHVAGTMLARGASATSLGMAPGAVIDAYDSTNDNSEMVAAGAAAPGEAGKIYISNHSYGFISGWRPETATWYGLFTDDGNPANDVETRFGRYDSTSVALDGLLYNLPYFLSFMSSGNDRNDDPPATGGNWTQSSGGAIRTYDPAQHPASDGAYKAGYDVLDNEKTCKNVITIGAANDAVSAGLRNAANGTLTAFSSTGPADDGRIKPDVVANGASLTSALSTGDSAYGSMSGTSMAAPNASGSALLLVDYFQQRFPGQAMQASTLKGLLIHTANDIGRAGPDYEYGWGLINIKAAADLIKTEADNVRMQQINEQVLAQGGSNTHPFYWDGVSPIRVTLCWTDPAGVSSSSHDNRTRDLTNDLNLRLTAPGGATHRPFVMPYVGDWTNAQLTAVATTGINTVDNVEQVLVSAPAQAGEYVVTVDHTGSLTFGSQGYSLIISGAVWPTALALTPEGPLASEGFTGGPFTPVSKTYDLSNTSAESVPWTAVADQPWVQVSPSSGTLAAGQNVTVTVGFSASAANLAAGNYEAEVLLTDTLNNLQLTRQVTLQVLGTAPQIVVKNAADQVLNTGGPAVSVGNVQLGGNPADQVFKLANSVPGTSLEVDGLTLSGADAGSFALVSAPVGAALASTDSLPFIVRFNPQRAGAHSATLTITTNDPDDGPFIVFLTATATAAPGPAQTIAVAKISPRATSGGPFQLPAVATSGLPLTYTLLAGPATVNADGLVTPGGSTGAVTIQISQPGNGQYAAAVPVTVTFVLTDQPYRFAKVSVANTGSHTLAIGLDGRLWAWGLGSFGQLGQGSTATRFTPETTGSATDWAEVSAGGNHSLAIKTNGSLWAWGSSSSGQVGDATTVSKFTPIQIDPGPWIAISAGTNCSYAIKANGTLWAWGGNISGELGIGSTGSRTIPTQVGSLSDWQSVSSGSSHCLAVKKDGTLWAWGLGTNGQLGTGSLVSSTSPVQIGSATNWWKAAGGGVHSLALRRDGTLWSWGFSGNGQLGSGSTTATSTPNQVGTATDWVEVDASTNHSAGVRRDGSAWAWGRNSEAQIGNGNQVNQLAPVKINVLGDDWRFIEAGPTSGGALLADGTFVGWGDGLGYVGKSSRQLVRAIGPMAWADFSSRNTNTLLTKTDGSLWGFGSSSTGQMGNNSINPQDLIRIGAVSTWQTVQTGQFHSGGIQQNGSLWMWGFNSGGQIGDGTTTVRYLPLPVALGSTWRKLSLGNSHSMAIRSDGTLWAWGTNTAGEFGDGGTVSRTSPVQVGSETNWAQLSASSFYSLALKEDGSLWATGTNNVGQLGLEDFTTRTSFTQVGTGKDWAQIATTTSSSFAIKTDGSLWAWGTNSSGQLGLGNTTSRSVPVRVGTDNDWRQVTCNTTWTAALKQDGSLWTWGNNSTYQQGVAIDGSISSPRRVGNSTGWVAVQAGNVHLVAMRADGSIWTAGYSGSFRLTSGGGRSAFVQAPILPALQPQNILPLPTGFRSGRILASSGLPVELEIVSGSGSIAGDLFTHTGAVGSTTVVMAWQRGDETAWNAALPTQFSITTQDITFQTIAEQTCGTPLVLGATASSGLPVSYAITEGADIASLNGNTVTFHAAGTVTIQANQAGGGNGLAAADPVSRTFTVVKGEQVISFGGQVPTQSSFASTVALQASSSRGLTPVEFAVVSGPGTLNGSQLSFTQVGVVVVRAAQAGNDAFLPAEVTMEITAFNTLPVASGAAFTLDEDMTITGTAAATDVENTPLAYAVVTGPEHGALLLNPNTGAFSYTPTAHYFGGDSFSFKVNDGLADSNIATVTLTVNAVNDRPVAVGQALSTLDYLPLAITLAGQDVETPGLQFSIVTPPAHGSLTGTAPGLVYTADQGYAGTDSFTFAVSDGELTSMVGTVSIQVSVVGITFIQHPLSKKVSETEDVTLEVEVTGSKPITYQWVKAGQPLPGETGATLTLTDVTAADAGLYHVWVTNPVRLFESQGATVSVIGGLPEILVQPEHQLAVVGTEVVLGVQALGKPPLRYQWRKDGKTVAGATQAELRLPAVQLAQAGNYTVVVSSAEPRTSLVAKVGVAENPGKTILVTEGGNTSWSFKTAGEGLSLVWTDDGGELSENPRRVISSDAKKISLTDAELEDAGLYVCKVFGPGGELDAGTHDLRVINGAPDVTPLQSGDALPPSIVGEDYEFEVPMSADEHRSPASFAATGLPAGLKIDPLTGIISGRVTASKSTPYAVKITAKNLLGSDVVNVALLVSPLPAGSIGTFVAPLPRHAFNDDLGGRLDLVTTSTGSFSGKLTLGGRKPISFKGGLLSMSSAPGSRPAGAITVSQPAPLSPLELSFVLDPETCLMAATLTDGSAPVVFEGWKSTWSVRDPADAFDGLYNLGLTGEAGEDIPVGRGFAAVTVAKAGSLKLAGKTGDGEALLGSTFLGPQGQILVFQTMYKTPLKGSLVGTLQIKKGANHQDDQDNTIDGEVTWSRPAGTGRTYPRGFGPLNLDAVGQRYLPPTSPNIVLGLADSPDNAWLRFTGAGIESSSTRPDMAFQITPFHQMLLPKAGAEKNPGRVTLKLNAKTGQLSGTFLLVDEGPPGSSAPVQRKGTYEGLIYTDAEGRRGYGFFLLPGLPETVSQPAASTPVLSGQMRLESP
ncbi:S8 family serine peptidase [Prosthecobacter algae]|uniref:RCC1 domain-containing protein n=1 Tax=Prosthecobacter algae TaxID=1144682 RepID=UPI0031F0FC91